MQQKHVSEHDKFLEENRKLKGQVKELKETFSAIRNDQVDALIIKTSHGDRVFTLKGADQSYRLLIEQMKEGAALLSNDDQTMLYSNNSLANLLGEPLHKVMCGDIRRYIAPNHRKVFEELLIECRKSKKQCSKEITLQRSDGKLVPTIMSLSTVPLEGTEATYTVVTDMTEHMEEEVKNYTRTLEKEVKEKTDALKDAERMAAIGQTAGMVGHDIRNPLQTIIGELYLAKGELKQIKDCPSKLQVKEMLNTIEEQVTYINKIVTDLQDFAKPAKPQFTQTDFKRLLEETIRTIDIPTTITTSIKIQKHFPTLLIDRFMTQRILTNLITNAVQAIPEKGKISIEATKRGTAALIRIADTGSGISKDIKSSIFKPLFSTKAKGQGFGLAVVKRFVEAQGGEIKFQSEEGKGTEFAIKLPIN